MTPVFPLDPGGAAGNAVAWLGRRGRLSVADLTARPRWGIKGTGSADWLSVQGVALPPVNRHVESGPLTILRLGDNDVTVLTDADGPSALNALRTAWEAAPAPKGYPSWREESWAWLALSGDGLDEQLAYLTAFDLRPARFGPDEIAQTRVAHVDATMLRKGDAMHLFFDVTATASVLRRIAEAAEWIADGRIEGDAR